MAQLRYADVERWVDSVTDMPPPRSDERDARAGDPGKERQLVPCLACLKSAIEGDFDSKDILHRNGQCWCRPDTNICERCGPDGPCLPIPTHALPVAVCFLDYTQRPRDRIDSVTRWKYRDAVKAVLEAIESGDFPRTNDPRLKKGGAGFTR
uniref:Uncharacterized protein n=1 Tax=Gibberella zeae TaxID=5518 RepID=A0A4E9EMM5_GIBZA